ncbi:hypothetical protein [Aliarcobacter butzleri]|uniref:hypothetical protein n=1 Tax=Aliarcobacter butzleri TaxID=28197 RepID=UPI001917BFCD|nr:hypothetical protein [Aliarcobacter butzleri]
MKKNILLIPTTDHTVLCFKELYDYINEDYEIFILLDNKFIEKRYEFKKIKVLNFSSYQLLENMNHKNIFAKLFQMYLFSKYVIESFEYYHQKYHFDFIVSSNDNAYLGNIIINRAKRYNIKSFVQQIASTIINNKTKEGFIKKIKKKLIDKLMGMKSKGYCGNADYLLFMGESWISTVNTFQKKYFIVPNAYYYNLKNTKKINNDIEKKKKNVVFFSGPFFEIGLFNEENTVKIYQFIDELYLKLGNKYNLFIKSHPQEKLIYKYDFKSKFEYLKLTPDESLDFCDISLSLSSSMSLQTKILGKLSLGIHPEFCPKEYIDTSIYFFDKTYLTVQDLLDDLLNAKIIDTNKNYSVDKIVDLSKDPVKEMEKIFQKVLKDDV